MIPNPLRDPTDEDVACQGFRVVRRAGSVCCEGHHAEMIMLALVGDYNDSDIMFRCVRSCESLREFGMQHGWLRENANYHARKCELGHKLPLIDEYLKKSLDL